MKVEAGGFAARLNPLSIVLSGMARTPSATMGLKDIPPWAAAERSGM